MKEVLRSPILLATALVLLFAADSLAQKQVPYGSYRDTCQSISVSGNRLTALCKPKNGSVLTQPLTNLDDFFLCSGDIANIDGVLQCTKGAGNPQLDKMVKTMNAAFRTVIGSDQTEDPITWVRLYFKRRDDATWTFYKGFTSAIAEGFFIECLKLPNFAEPRKWAISNAWEFVYGKQPSPAEFAFWNAELLKNGGSSPRIAGVETNKLNSNKINRRFMITAAYKRSLGRPASAKELDFWTPRTEVFGPIVEANRTYLYSAGGAAELPEVIKRRVYEKTGENPTPKQSTELIIKYTKTKAIFSEM